MGELVDAQEGIRRSVSGGAIVGEFAAVAGETAQWTIRASSYVTAVQIPDQLYMAFIRDNHLEDTTRRVLENRRFLLDTWLFGEILGYPVERAVASAMRPMHVGAGETVGAGPEPRLLLVGRGEVALTRAGQECERLARKAFFGEDEVLYGTRMFTASALTPTSLFAIPAVIVADIPIVQWKLLQTSEKRLRVTSRSPAATRAGERAAAAARN